MTDVPDEEIRGLEMSRAAIDDFLTEQGHGTLSLSADRESYAVPISVGYDGEALFLNLISFGEESLKLEFLDATEEACVVVTEVADRFDWRSVVARGPVSEVPPDREEYHKEVLDDNGWFPVIFPPTGAMTGVTRVRLEPRDLTGRKGKVHQS